MRFIISVVLAQTLVALSAERGDPIPDSDLIVTSAKVPHYPEVAVAARIAGKFTLHLHVKDGDVISSEVTSNAPRILAEAAKRDVRTWRFRPNVTGTTNVEFSYELEAADKVYLENPYVEMHLPSWVRLRAKAVKHLPTDSLR